MRSHQKTNAITLTGQTGRSTTTIISIAMFHFTITTSFIGVRWLEEAINLVSIDCRQLYDSLTIHFPA